MSFRNATATVAALAASSTETQTAAEKAAAKAAKAAKALRKSYQNNHPLYLWWTVAAVIGLFMLANAIRIVHQYHRRRRALRLAKAHTETTEFGSSSASRPGVASRAVNAVLTATNKGFSWREFTIALWWKVTAGELFWSAMYTFVVFLLGLIYLPIHNTTARAQASMVGNRCGILAFSQLPLIVGLASKNNVISYLTGISYEKLNFLHRASGRACLVLSWIHTIDRGMILDMKGKHAITTWEMQMGVVALLAYSLLVGLSVKPLLRRVAYEAFLISHIVLALIFLIGAYFHWEKFGYWVWPSFVIWAFDRLARLANTIILNKLWLSLRPSSTNPSTVGSVRVLPGEALELTITRSMRWFAGQHAYLVCPTVSTFPLEAHPFTIASIPSTEDGPSDVTFIISERDGFTKRLGALARAAGGRAEITACIDGPYGYVRSLDSYHSVVLVAGGSGVSYTAGLLSQVVKDCKAGKSAVKNVTFVWVIRTTDQIDWIASSLAKNVRDCPPSLHIDLRIHVTRNTLPILNEKSTPVNRSENNSSRSSNDICDTVSPETPVTGEDEKKAGGPTPSALLFATSLREGRPDFGPLLHDCITDAGAGAVAVNVCGPDAMSTDIKKALASGQTTLGLGDVASGKIGHVALHCEAFGW